MLSTETLNAARVLVLTGEQYAQDRVHKRDPRTQERVRDYDVVLTDLINGIGGKIHLPYPSDTYGTHAVALKREQAEKLVMDLLKILAGGELPDDPEELLSFLTSLKR